jgi:hypothetical protein
MRFGIWAVLRTLIFSQAQLAAENAALRRKPRWQLTPAAEDLGRPPTPPGRFPRNPPAPTAPGLRVREVRGG